MSAIIFIGSPEKAQNISLSKLIFVDPYDVLFRIVASFVPPFSKNFRKVYVDFLGPSMAIFLLCLIVNFGNYLKDAKILLGPNEFIAVYSIAVPILCFSLGKLGQSSVTFYETLSLFGYSYGDLLTLLVSYVTFHEESNAVFFVCLCLFTGLSTLRFVLVLLKTIPKPGPRLVICSLVALIKVLSLIFIHFVYMHRTYSYRNVNFYDNYQID